MQIEEVPQFTTTKKQYDSSKSIVYEVKFTQVSVNAAPRHAEEDDITAPMFPHDARLRNLTYNTEMYVDIKFSKKELDDYFYDCPITGQRKRKVKNQLTNEEEKRVFLGKVPVMLRSDFC